MIPIKRNPHAKLTYEKGGKPNYQLPKSKTLTHFFFSYFQSYKKLPNKKTFKKLKLNKQKESEIKINRFKKR